MAAIEAPGDEARDPPKKGSIKSTLIEVALTTLIALGAGAMLATLLFPPTPHTPGGAKGEIAARPPRDAKGCATSSISLVDLPPIVTNLGSPTDVWVRVEASIVVDAKPSERADVLAAEIATDELAYLRTLSIAQLEGPIGLENIRQDLTDRAVVRSKGKVSEFILKTLVLQ